MKVRMDGGLCNFTSGYYPHNPVWIAIVGPPEIVQIGFIHDYHTGTSGDQWCKFWANGTGQITDYGCGTTVQDTLVYFKIVRYYDNISHAYYYEIDDCGETGGARTPYTALSVRVHW